jgi:putative endopeptidase
VPHINFGGLSLPDKSYYTEKESELKPEFNNMLLELFKGLEIETMDKTDLIWSIEKDISSAHYDKAEKRDPLKTYHPCTMDIFMKLTNNKYSALTEILPREYKDVVINNDELPNKISEVFENYDLDSLKTWVIWKIIKSKVTYSSGELYKTYFNFYGAKLSGTKVPRPLEERAVTFTQVHLGDEFSKIYMDDYVDPLLKYNFPRFVEKLREVVGNKLSNAPWMSDKTKKLALDKLHRMNLKVVGPSKFEDYSIFNKEYSSIFEFVDDFDKWDWDELEVNRKMYKLHDPEEWLMDAVDINAYYHPYYNEIVFPAAILQEPFYSSNYTFGENAGGIGAVICHEISHGFDDEGSKYDSDGFLHNWWSKQDRENYEKVISPMENYFNTLEYNSKSLNGRLTQGENLADLGGLKCSLAACENDTEKRNCINAWAKTWRANLRDEYAEQMIVVDPHSLPRFRINGILPHIEDFYRLFDVNEDDKMFLDKSKRCNLYD